MFAITLKDVNSFIFQIKNSFIFKIPMIMKDKQKDLKKNLIEKD